MTAPDLRGDARPARPVDEALALRRWALPALAGPAPAPPPPPASPRGWALFLMAERCAVALADALGPATRRDPRLETLRERARVEAQRVLSARAILAQVSAEAGRRGWRLVVLKGAVPLLRHGAGIDLLDVDLWGSPEHAREVAAFLDERGFAARGRAAAHRLALRAGPNTLPVEIHTSVPWLPPGADAWERLAPAGGLWTLAPADHAWHLLIHATEQHLERRGRIRELLLLRSALGDCSPEERDQVRRKALASTRSTVMLAHLALAEALAPGGPPLAGDPFELTAASVYVLTRRAWWVPEPVSSLLWRAAAELAARREGGAAGLGASTLHIPSAHPGLSRLRRVAPGAEQVVRLAIRRLPTLVLAPAAYSVAGAAARALRRAGA